MKKLFLIASLFVVTTAKAQTRTGEYNKVVTDQWQPAKDQSIAVTKWHNGTIKVNKLSIVIDGQPVYKITSRSKITDLCYDDTSDHAGIQFFTAIQGTKVIKGYLMYRDDKKTITDVVFQAAKSIEITYTFNNH